MNRQKQQEIKGFLGWLESYLGIIGGGPHAQDRSSQGYYEHVYGSFLAVLKKNKKKLAIDPARGSRRRRSGRSSIDVSQ
jgi:hypothetical protein